MSSLMTANIEQIINAAEPVIEESFMVTWLSVMQFTSLMG